MKKLALFNPREVTEEEVSTYGRRNAARAVVIDQQGQVALLHVARDNYYKLPGGGMEEGEDLHKALQRECLEEIGCEIEVVNEVGSTTEYFKEDNENQTSYCFLARVVGEKGLPALSESETERGFNTVWLPYDEAIARLQKSTPTQWEGEYIVPRELTFLEAAKEVFPMRKAILLPFNSRRELFIQDRRGFKKPDWGYFGGTIEEDETPLEAVIRETEEELCVVLSESDIKYLGISVTDWEGNLNIRYLFLYRGIL